MITKSVLILLDVGCCCNSKFSTNVNIMIINIARCTILQYYYRIVIIMITSVFVKFIISIKLIIYNDYILFRYLFSLTLL